MQQNNHRIKTVAVIVGLDLIGDALIKLPFLKVLRAAFPAAEISWLTSQGKTAYADALRELVRPYLDHIWEQPEWLPTKARPQTTGQRPHFDLIIDTRGRWHEALRARRVPHGIFIAPAFRYLFSDKRPPGFWRKPSHIQDRLLEQIHAAAGHLPSVAGGIAIPDAIRAKAAAIMPPMSTNPSARYVGLVPGAGNKVKIWPREYFIALAAMQAKAGHVPVILLGPQEAADLPIWQKALPNARFPLQNQIWERQISLEATMAIGERLACAVTNDNGTSHMLAAVDCPLVSLFGPTSATKLAPRVTQARVVTAQQFGQTDMAAIPVETVNRAVADMVGIN